MTDRRYVYNQGHDRFTDPNEDSTTHKLKNAYWTTKQVVIKKLGRKEDEHVVASDSELDAKLELFRSVQKTSADMTRILERYQDKICMLSQAENELGRFLKNHGSEDKTRAGKMMIAVGKSLSFSAQQRLALRVPLSRLHQEVETFRFRAISDTYETVSKMEARRTEYRAALLWMKDVSENLDPDTYRQLDKFRKVQKQVRSTKEKFDKIKLDSMQKVDLLAASRCNMFSHVLCLYQATLLQFWEKTCRTMVAVADSFKGYQYYEFSMLKDLTDESRKLAKLTRKQENQEKDEVTQKEIDDFDKLNKRLDEIFTGGDFKEDPDKEIKEAIESNKLNNSKKNKSSERDSDILGGIGGGNDSLVGLDDEFNERQLLDDFLKPSGINSGNDGTGANLSDLMSSDILGGQESSSIFDLIGGNGSESKATGDWNSLFQSRTNQNSNSEDELGSLSRMMPSALLDMRATDMTSSGMGSQSTGSVQPPPYMPSGFGCGNDANLESMTAQQSGQPSGKLTKDSAAAWINMFADLDPLANPDSISKNEGQITDT